MALVRWSSSGSRRARTGLLMAAGAMVILTSCSQIKAGSAASVGDESLSESTVASTVDEINDVLADADLESTLPPDELTLQVVARWVDGKVTEEVASAEDVTITDGEIDTLLEQYDAAARADITAQAGIPPSELDDAARTLLLQQKVAQALEPDGTQEEQSQAFYEALATTADELGVSVNPRFGEWNPAIPGVGPRAEDRLSSPETVDEPTAPPAPGVP